METSQCVDVRFASCDGIAFLYGGTAVVGKVVQDLWNVHGVDAPEDQRSDFEEKGDLGFKYTICLYPVLKEDQRNIYSYEVFDAILGDPAHFVNTCIKSMEGGFILKKSAWAQSIISKFVEEMEELKNVLHNE